MAAADHLSGQQFFHGSVAELQPGDVIKPGAEVGKNNYPYLKSWRNQHVWLTDDPQAAHNWADYRSAPTHAYEVEPAETPQRRRRFSGDNPSAQYTVSSARVVREMPRHQQGHFNTGASKEDPLSTVYGSGYSNDQHKYYDPKAIEEENFNSWTPRSPRGTR